MPNYIDLLQNQDCEEKMKTTRCRKTLILVSLCSLRSPHNFILIRNKKT